MPQPTIKQQRQVQFVLRCQKLRQAQTTIMAYGQDLCSKKKVQAKKSARQQKAKARRQPRKSLSSIRRWYCGSTGRHQTEPRSLASRRASYIMERDCLLGDARSAKSFLELPATLQPGPELAAQYFPITRLRHQQPRYVANSSHCCEEQRQLRVTQVRSKEEKHKPPRISDSRRRRQESRDSGVMLQNKTCTTRIPREDDHIPITPIRNTSRDILRKSHWYGFARGRPQILQRDTDCTVDHEKHTRLQRRRKLDSAIERRIACIFVLR